MFLNTPSCRTILSVSFDSLFSAIVQLLPQIIVRKNMHTALFCVVCALPVFIIVYKHCLPVYAKLQCHAFVKKKCVIQQKTGFLQVTGEYYESLKL